MPGRCHPNPRSAPFPHRLGANLRPPPAADLKAVTRYRDFETRAVPVPAPLSQPARRAICQLARFAPRPHVSWTPSLLTLLQGAKPRAQATPQSSSSRTRSCRSKRAASRSVLFPDGLGATGTRSMPGSASSGSESMRGAEFCRQSSSNGGGRRDTQTAKKLGAIQTPLAASQTPPCPRSPVSSAALWQAPRFLRAEE